MNNTIINLEQKIETVKRRLMEVNQPDKVTELLQSQYSTLVEEVGVASYRHAISVHVNWFEVYLIDQNTRSRQ